MSAVTIEILQDLSRHLVQLSWAEFLELRANGGMTRPQCFIMDLQPIEQSGHGWKINKGHVYFQPSFDQNELNDFLDAKMSHHDFWVTQKEIAKQIRAGTLQKFQPKNMPAHLPSYGLKVKLLGAPGDDNYAVDNMIYIRRAIDDKLCILLIQRVGSGKLAYPGGFARKQQVKESDAAYNDSLRHAAMLELVQECFAADHILCPEDMEHCKQFMVNMTSQKNYINATDPRSSDQAQTVTKPFRLVCTEQAYQDFLSKLSVKEKGGDDAAATLLIPIEQTINSVRYAKEIMRAAKGELLPLKNPNNALMFCQHNAMLIDGIVEAIVAGEIDINHAVLQAQLKEMIENMEVVEKLFTFPPITARKGLFFTYNGRLFCD